MKTGQGAGVMTRIEQENPAGRTIKSVLLEAQDKYGREEEPGLKYLQELSRCFLRILVCSR